MPRRHSSGRRAKTFSIDFASSLHRLRTSRCRGPSNKGGKPSMIWTPSRRNRCTCASAALPNRSGLLRLPFRYRGGKRAAVTGIDERFSDLLDRFRDIRNGPPCFVRMGAGHIEAPRPPGRFAVVFHVMTSRSFRNHRLAKDGRCGSNGSGAYWLAGNVLS